MQNSPLVTNLIFIIPIVIVIGIAIWIIYLINTKQLLNNDTIPSNTVNLLGLRIRKVIINKVFLLLGGLPLLLLPFVLIADVMLLASFSMVSFNYIEDIKNLFIIVFIHLYLLTYIFAFVKNSKNKNESIIYTAMPLIHFVLIIILINII